MLVYRMSLIQVKAKAETTCQISIACEKSGVISSIIHCSWGNALQAPLALPNPLTIEFHQIAHSDWPDYCVEKNRPHCSDESLLTYIAGFVIANLNDQKPNFTPCYHRRTKKKAGDRCSTIVLLLFFDTG